MTELKTLKDFRMECHNGDVYLQAVWKKDVKQEAIKWVKHYQDRIFHLNERVNKGLKIEKMELWELIGKSNALMDFNNITEEDLK